MVHQSVINFCHSLVTLHSRYLVGISQKGKVFFFQRVFPLLSLPFLQKLFNKTWQCQQISAWAASTFGYIKRSYFGYLLELTLFWSPYRKTWLQNLNILLGKGQMQVISCTVIYYIYEAADEHKTYITYMISWRENISTKIAGEQHRNNNSRTVSNRVFRGRYAGN